MFRILCIKYRDRDTISHFMVNLVHYSPLTTEGCDGTWDMGYGMVELAMLVCKEYERDCLLLRDLETF